MPRQSPLFKTQVSITSFLAPPTPLASSTLHIPECSARPALRGRAPLAAPPHSLLFPRCNTTPFPQPGKPGGRGGARGPVSAPPLTSELREPFSTCLVRAMTSVPQVFTFSVRSPFTDWPNRACGSGAPVAIAAARERLRPGDGESPGPKEPQSGREKRRPGREALCLAEADPGSFYVPLKYSSWYPEEDRSRANISGGNGGPFRSIRGLKIGSPDYNPNCALCGTADCSTSASCVQQ